MKRILALLFLIGLVLIFIKSYTIPLGKAEISANTPLDSPVIIKKPENIIPKYMEYTYYYEHYDTASFNKFELDSFYGWIKNFGPVDIQSAVTSLMSVAGDRFFLMTDKELTKIILSKYRIEVGDSYSKYSHHSNELTEYLKRIDQSKVSDPIMQIWDENNLFFEKGGEINLKGEGYDSLSKNLILRINSLTSYYDSTHRIRDLKDTVSFRHIKKSILTIKDNNLKIKLNFILWYRLFNENVISPSFWQPVNAIDSLNTITKNISPTERAQWNLALAKIYASVDIRYYANATISFLSRANYLVNYRSTLEEKEKAYIVELTKSIFWTYLPGRYGKSQALRQCVNFFHSNYTELSNDDKVKFYSFLVYFWSLIIGENLNELRLTTDREHLRFAHNLLNAYNENCNYNEGTTELRLTFSIAKYYMSIKDYKEAKKWFCVLLDKITNTVKKDKYYSVENTINNIQSCNIELRDQKDFMDWYNFMNINKLHSNSNPSQFLKYVSIEKWSLTNKTNFGNYVINNRVDTILRYYPNREWLKNAIKKSSKLSENSNSILNTNYKLLLKYDTIWATTETDKETYFNLGIYGSQNLNVVEKNEILWENQDLQSKIDSQQTILIELNLAIDKSKIELKNSYAQIELSKYELKRSAFELKKNKAELEKGKIELWQVNIDLNHKRDSIGTLESLTEQLSLQKDKAVRATKKEISLRKQVQESRDRYKIAVYIMGAFALILVLVLSLAIYQWKRASKATKEALKQKQRAEELSALSEFKAKIWQEFGHVPSSAINTAYRISKKINAPELALKTLIMLENFLSNLFKNLRGGNDFNAVELNQELMLANDYVNYCRYTGDKNIDFKLPTNIPFYHIPPAIILSCVKNAIEHGEANKIAVEIQKKDTFYEISISDNGIGLSENIKSIADINEGTGLKNANNILNYFNNSINQEDYVRFSGSKTDEYKNKILLKVKLK